MRCSARVVLSAFQYVRMEFSEKLMRSIIEASSFQLSRTWRRARFADYVRWNAQTLPFVSSSNKLGTDLISRDSLRFVGLEIIQ